MRQALRLGKYSEDSQCEAARNYLLREDKGEY